MAARTNWETNELISTEELNNIGLSINNAAIKELPYSKSSYGEPIVGQVLTYVGKDKWLNRTLPLINLVDGEGTYSVAGKASTSSGNYSFSFGNNSTSSGIGSTSFGSDSVAAGDNSFAQNRGTIANIDNQTVIGRYNEPENKLNELSSKSAFIIGNGSSNSNRSNALKIGWDGKVVSNGDYVFYDTTNDTSHALSNKSDSDHDHDSRYLILNDENIDSQEISGDIIINGNLTIPDGQLHIQHISVQEQTSLDLGYAKLVCGNNDSAFSILSGHNYWLEVSDNRDLTSFYNIDEGKLNEEDSYLMSAINNAFLGLEDIAIDDPDIEDDVYGSIYIDTTPIGQTDDEYYYYKSQQTV